MRLSTRALTVTIALVLLLVLAACASGESTKPAESPTSESTATATAEQPTNTPAPAEPTSAPTEESAPSSGMGMSTEAPDPDAVNPILFAIDPAQSEARFIINEELMGNPKTVIGTNTGVSGQATVDPGNPTSVELGLITIDTGGFVTDNSRRDGAINRFILQSSSYPSVTFAPTAIEGVAEDAAIGDTLNLQITGNLTIREITRPETFSVAVEIVSTSELRVNGTTQILRENYDLTIPSVPSVANVTNEVQLEFDFVLVAQ